MSLRGADLLHVQQKSDAEAITAIWIRCSKDKSYVLVIADKHQGFFCLFVCSFPIFHFISTAWSKNTAVLRERPWGAYCEGKTQARIRMWHRNKVSNPLTNACLLFSRCDKKSIQVLWVKRKAFFPLRGHEPAHEFCLDEHRAKDIPCNYMLWNSWILQYYQNRMFWEALQNISRKCNVSQLRFNKQPVVGYCRILPH